MCIIIYKPAGIAMPDQEILGNCFANHQDGAGFAHTDDLHVPYFEKGFFVLSQLIDRMNARIKVGHRAMVHFRTGTGSPVSAGFCHPFPITEDYRLMREMLGGHSPELVFHNGIFGKSTKEYSDTMNFIAEELSGYEFGQQEADLLEDHMGWGALAVMTKAEDYLVGKWYHYKGCWFSNDSFRHGPKHPSYNSYFRQFSYDDYDGDEDKYWELGDS